MTTLERIRRLFRYDEWANRETLRSLEEAGDPPVPAVRIMAHIVGAERLWHGRLRDSKEPAAVWPALTMAECRSGLDELSVSWGSYLRGLAEEGLARGVSYVNSKGEPWTSSVEDILTHAVFHSTHHRGQIATALRAAGHVPAYTDYIHAVRRGLLR
jgi:uncharacterized damage-inducible protein DinB